MTSRITNHTSQALDFVVQGKRTKDGEAVTEHVLPGETKEIDVDVESATVQGYALSGAITLDKRSAAKVEKAANTVSAAS